MTTEAGMVEDMVQERIAVSQCSSLFNELRKEHPEWFALYDETDPDTCSRAELVDLMASAPTPFSKGVVYGKYSMRLAIEAITGRPFA